MAGKWFAGGTAGGGVFGILGVTFQGAALNAAGFTAVGPAAGSSAAAWMSSIAVGNGVGVQAGSLYAACQTAAMGGGALLGAPFVIGMCVTGAAVVGVTGMTVRHLKKGRKGGKAAGGDDDAVGGDEGGDAAGGDGGGDAAAGGEGGDAAGGDGCGDAAAGGEGGDAAGGDGGGNAAGGGEGGDAARGDGGGDAAGGDGSGDAAGGGEGGDVARGDGGGGGDDPAIDDSTEPVSIEEDKTEPR